MTRILAAVMAVILMCCGTARVAVADEAAQLAKAMTAMRKADWETALQVAGPRGSVARDIIVWHWLRAGLGSAGDVEVFVDRRADWPGMDWLRRKSESSFTNEPAARVLSYFKDQPPQGAEGVLAHAGALLEQGQTGDAHAELVLAWRTMAMGSGLQDIFLKRYGKLLAPHHAARLDRMIWDGHLVSARRMLRLVNEGESALAQARIALLDLAPGVDTLISRVPESLSKDPGLAHARFVWRDRKGRDDDAVELLLERSKSPELLGEPDKWATRRRNLARQEMRNGYPERAYRIAAHHFVTPEAGYAFADLEWIAGYVALVKLDDPNTAVRHFERFKGAVSSPISQGRAGYWLGRAYAAAGNADKAYEAYALGAEQQTSFYGLLAAEQIGRPFDPELANPPPPPPWRQATFLQSSVTNAALLLLKAGELTLSERFLTHLVESLDETQGNQLGAMVIDMGQPHLAVMIAKRAATKGMVLPTSYYPLHPVAGLRLPMAKEMTLAIARRESEFDPGVVSGAGARGLMQVMPRTAELVAQDLGIAGQHSTGRLTQEWEYNAKLGANYLAGLAADFRGNVVMMSAGYNAGPGRPIRWMETYGDPRQGHIDIVDWIEHIPFNETRNYVMRVTESLPIYRARLGATPLPTPFSRELVGSTLSAFAP